jgi:uncharacterized protein
MRSFTITGRNKVKRLPKRGHYDEKTVFEILDSSFICHIGFVENGQPFVIPTAYGRDGNCLYVHGSAKSRMLSSLEKGLPVCVTVTQLDGLVLARSAFHHSMNYRSVVVFGNALEIEGEEKLHGLYVISESILKGRWSEVRGPNAKEMKATSVLKITIEEASAKLRNGPPGDDDEDYALPIWAGVVPLCQTPGQPENDPLLSEGIDLPESVKALFK